jgi:ceramide glucosyltransferase
LFHFPARLPYLIGSGIMLGLTVAGIFYYLAAAYAALRFAKHKVRTSIPFEPPVTIVKPLYGVEANTYEALESFCVQNYPCFQIIFSVRSAVDPAVALVHQLIHNHPLLDLSLVVSDHTWGANNKVNNMANALIGAKYPIYVFADSDVWVRPDYLTSILQPLQDARVGLVTTMYRTRPIGWIAAFEALATSTEFFPSVLLARQLEGMAFAFGATVAIRREVLDSFGGLPLISNYLADDFKIGECTAKAGYKVILSGYVVDHALTTRSLQSLVLHQLRWARGNRFSRPWGTFGLLFTYGSISSLVYLLLTHGSDLALLLFLVSWVLRYALGWAVGVRLLRDEPASRLLWLVRDLVSFLIWSASWFGSEVEWNTRRFKLSRGGWISEHPSPMSPISPSP